MLEELTNLWHEVWHEEHNQAYLEEGMSHVDDTFTVNELISNAPSAPNKRLEKDEVTIEDIIDKHK